jgi:hypothetical protein
MSSNSIARTLTNNILSIGTMFLRGWAITKLWGWFAVPQFGLKELTLFTALGLSLLVEVMMPLPASTVQAETQVSNKGDDITDRHARRIGLILASVTLGWLFK